MNGWPPVNVFYVRGALTWLSFATLAVAVVMALVSVNLLVASVDTPSLRHGARLVVAFTIGAASLVVIRRLLTHA